MPNDVMRIPQTAESTFLFQPLSNSTAYPYKQMLKRRESLTICWQLELDIQFDSILEQLFAKDLYHREASSQWLEQWPFTLDCTVD